jgi:hypothetical protein
MAGGGLQQGSNVFSQAAQGLGTAGAAARNLTGFKPQTLAQTDLTPYQNPFTQQVVDRSLGSIDRMRQMGINQVGANATGAGAFGGSRHGVAEAETNRAAMEQAANTSANLFSQGFGQAQNAAKFDIGNQFNAANTQLQAANQLGSLSNLGFGMGRQVQQDQLAQGGQQQALMQQLLNNAKSQYSGYTNAPGKSLQYPLASIGGVPQPQTQTTSSKPGLLGLLSMGLGLL